MAYYWFVSSNKEEQDKLIKLAKHLKLDMELNNTFRDYPLMIIYLEDSACVIKPRYILEDRFKNTLEKDGKEVTINDINQLLFNITIGNSNLF